MFLDIRTKIIAFFDVIKLHRVSRSLKEETQIVRSEKILLLCQFFYHKSNMYWSEIETGPPRLKGGDWQPEKWYGRILVHVKNNKHYTVYKKVMSKYTFTGLEMRELGTHCTEKTCMFKLTSFKTHKDTLRKKFLHLLMFS
jgi:hypothetical protein